MDNLNDTAPTVESLDLSGIPGIEEYLGTPATEEAIESSASEEAIADTYSEVSESAISWASISSKKFVKSLPLPRATNRLAKSNSEQMASKSRCARVL